MINNINTNYSSSPSNPSGGTAIQQLQQLLAEYEALFAQWEAGKTSNISHMGKIDAQLEKCMQQILQLIDSPQNQKLLIAALEQQGWEPGKSYGLTMNPFGLLQDIQQLAQEFQQGDLECTLTMFNECASSLVYDLTHKAPTTLGASLPEQAMEILVQIESILNQSCPLSPSQLQKLKTLSKELAHLLPSVNLGPNQKETAQAFAQFMDILNQAGGKSGVISPLNQNEALHAALNTLFHNLMM